MHFKDAVTQGAIHCSTIAGTFYPHTSASDKFDMMQYTSLVMLSGFKASILSKQEKESITVMRYRQDYSNPQDKMLRKPQQKPWFSRQHLSVPQNGEILLILHSRFIKVSNRGKVLCSRTRGEGLTRRPTYW